MSWTGASAEMMPGYRPSWAGLLRISLWCTLCLWIFGGFVPKPLPESVPYEKVLKGTGVTPMATVYNDPRAVREDISPGGKKINIAWISDSGEALVPPGKIIDHSREDEFRFLSGLVAGKLRAPLGLKNFGISLYTQLGLHPANRLFYALQAIRDKPDLIVIELNPIWSFSHYQFYTQRDSLYMAPALLAPQPELWRLIPLLASPSQDTLALLGDRFRILREMSPYKRLLMTPSPAQATVVESTPRDPTNYWILEQLLNGHTRSPTMASLGNHLVIQDFFLALLGEGSTDARDTLALGAFQEMLDALKASGIPVLIYNAPLDDNFYADPSARAKIGQIRDYLSAAAAQLAGTQIRIIPAIPEPIRKSIVFIPSDGFHKWQAGKLDIYLAREIMRIVVPQQPAPARSPKRHKHGHGRPAQ